MDTATPHPVTTDDPTLYTNATVITVDPANRVAGEFTVTADGRFGAVGDRGQLDRTGVRVVDLDGATVVPGFVDAHAHVVHIAMEDGARPSLRGLTSVATIAERIGRAAAAAPPGTWVVTTPMGEPPDFFGLPDALAEGRWPTRADLDAVAPDHPVLVPCTAHWPLPAVLNSAALALLGVTRDTPDEGQVRIVRDAAGEPTGVIHGLIFYNGGAQLVGRLMRVAPPPRVDRDVLADAFAARRASGFTSVYEGHGTTDTTDLAALHDGGRLACRVVATEEVPVGRPGVDLAEWMATRAGVGAGVGDDRFRLRGVTVSLDGPTHFGLAHTSEPFLDPHGRSTNGRSRVSVEELTELGRLAVRHDLRLNVLTSGDAACELAVTALEAVHRETPLTGRRWVAQHHHHVTRAQIGRVAALGLVAQVCAGVDHARGEEVYVGRLPGSGWETVTPLRWWLDAGVPLGLASDGAHPEPGFHLWAALTRIDARSGRSLLTPAKAVGPDEALRALTVGGAAVLGLDDRIGSIEPGKLADVAVLDRDPRTTPALRDLRVLATAVDGELSWS